jgi:hypothetical protein
MVSLGLFVLKRFDHVFPMTSPSAASIAAALSLLCWWVSLVRYWISFLICVVDILISSSGRDQLFRRACSVSESLAILRFILGWAAFSCRSAMSLTFVLKSFSQIWGFSWGVLA